MLYLFSRQQASAKLYTLTNSFRGLPRLPRFQISVQPAVAFSKSQAVNMSISAMAARLSGKTILITGASAGIGRSTALEFARTAPDCRLILTARREDALKQLAEEIKSEAGDKVEVLPVRLDVSNSADVKGLLDRLPEEWKEVDILVNNALVCNLR